ncbi:YncE family protein [Paraconexibacter algicola]|uniref:YncE family protein n=1 Tax=Paraconexibacter algicola TaxID=2133960 RepID=UPI00130494C7|nr:twin-arginine translocation signal domain-containing protein [Paraconexibacter algicola]
MPLTVTPTRRQLLQGGAGLAAAAALPAPTATAAPRPTDRRPDVVHRGRSIAVSPDGRRLAVAHAARRTLELTDRRARATRRVTLDGQPAELAWAPSGGLLAVTTAFWDAPGLELHGLDGRRTRLDVGPAPLAVAITDRPRRIVVAGGEQEGTLHVLSGPGYAQRRVVPLGAVPRGLAVHGDRAWVALQAEDAVVHVDLATGAVLRRVGVPALPDRIAIRPDGARLLVAHGGPARDLTELETRRGGRRRALAAAPAVGAVAYAPGGRRLAALPEAAAVLSIDARGRRRRLPTVSGPRGLAVAGRHVFVVSATTGKVGRVRP